jgi:hypothetical protein
MRLNVGSLDRIVRLSIGIALIAYAFFGLASPWSAVGLGAIAIGAILAVTGLISWCPIWAVAGVNTRKAAG